LSLIFIISISILSFFILHPFIVSFSWAIMLVVSTWPIMLKIESFLGGRRSLSILIIMTTVFLALTVPIFFIISSF
ncbi:MAG: AI-2E family transporter YdiK, partial [Buchnera aphidicola]|nr:AI-2E family transporter YdiK [Buchnera aphidicola]